MKTEKDKIIDKIIEEQKDCIAVGDFTVLDELLHHVPDEILIASLSEVNNGTTEQTDR
jgi:hypothetical protein